MKPVLITAFLFCFFSSTRAQNTSATESRQKDSLAIARVLEDVYFKGIYEGDVELLRPIYHPGCLLFGDIKGQPYAKTLDQYLDGVKNRQSVKASGKPFKGEIVDIRIVNSIAVAELKVKMYDFNYHEFLSFHPIDGKWVIVCKMLTDTTP